MKLFCQVLALFSVYSIMDFRNAAFHRFIYDTYRDMPGQGRSRIELDRGSIRSRPRNSFRKILSNIMTPAAETRVTGISRYVYKKQALSSDCIKP